VGTLAETAGMDRVAALLATLAVGALVAFQPPANALLARFVSDLGAAFVSLVVSAAIVGVLLVSFGDVGHLKGLSELRPEHLLGGIAGAAIVLVSLITVRSLGAGGVTAALVAMQLIVSAILDRLGVLGLPETALGWRGIVGMALLLAGTAMMTTR
jgi:transporter family-2 protein